MSQPRNLDRFQTLVEIIARLRAPDGCPWDRKQTHGSLRENLLEECYEVLAALDKGDSQRLCAELGDLLMQIVFHAQIAAEDGEFELGDVLAGINRKLIHRHPHIFGSRRVKSAEEEQRGIQVVDENGLNTSITPNGLKQARPVLIAAKLSAGK